MIRTPARVRRPDGMGLLSTVRMYARRSPSLDEPTDLYAHSVPLLEGGTLELETFRGRPALIVNTASKCGFTPQLEGLQALYAEYHDRGLEMLGCPSADFAGQEFDDAAETAAFCQRNYGVTFPMAATMSVRAEPAPLWEDLARQPGSGAPAWNFTKYLVGAEGRLLRRFSTKVAPDDPGLVSEIEAALQSAATVR
jgi:glutathione peroxidase-family protein